MSIVCLANIDRGYDIGPGARFLLIWDLEYFLHPVCPDGEVFGSYYHLEGSDFQEFGLSAIVTTFKIYTLAWSYHLMQHRQ